MQRSSKVLTHSALALLAALLPAVSSSQDRPAKESSSETGLAEIVVTAERYGATVQTTPVAITAMTTETLAERQISNVFRPRRRSLAS